MRKGIEIWSGGQTGVDRAALDCAHELGLAHGGWVPRGRVAEDGEIPACHDRLREAPTAEPDERTDLNVRDTDATLVLRWGEARGGTRRTIETARRLGRPLCEVDLAALTDEAGARAAAAWLDLLPPVLRLNVAGPRASEAPAVYGRARSLLRQLLGATPGTPKSAPTASARPTSSIEVRWFLDGSRAAHPALRRWFEEAAPFPRGEGAGRPAWVGRLGDEPDRYLLVEGADDLGIKWREGELQVKGRLADLGVVAFTDRHAGRVERWTKWAYRGLPASHRTLFAPRSDGPAVIAVRKSRAARKLALEAAGGAPREVAATAYVERGVGMELTELSAEGVAACSLAFEGYPDDAAMRAAFESVVRAFLEALGEPLDAAASASYPQWLGRRRSRGA